MATPLSNSPTSPPIHTQEPTVSKDAFIASVSSLYDTIYEMDLISDEINIWKPSVTLKVPDVANTSVSEYVLEIYQFFIHPNQRKPFMETFAPQKLLSAFRGGKKEIRADLLLLGVAETYRWYRVEVHPLPETETAFPLLVYVNDIHATKEEEEQQKAILTDALQTAERANSAKSDFLSRISHDIRTPMNAIIGMTTIATAQENVPPRVLDCLEKINASSRFLLSLINDILDMSKIESGKISQHYAPFAFREFMENIFSVCLAQAKEKDQTFSFFIEEAIENYYVGDTLHLHQILINLLTNALKYTPQGGQIQCLAHVVRLTTETTILSFQIIDSGIGMSTDFLQKIYEPFEQENDTPGRISQGTGLGLSIAQSLVHFMNGTISVSSALGQGTTFVVEVPLTRMEQPKAEQSCPSQDTLPTFCGERILVVEDNPLNLEIICTLLEMQGLTVDTAAHGLLAVERFCAAGEDAYRAILMDIRMPVMDGLTATRMIRNAGIKGAKTIPIIALTANAFQNEQLTARTAGMDAYLIKPVDAPLLYQTLYDLMKKHQGDCVL